MIRRASVLVAAGLRRLACLRSAPSLLVRVVVTVVLAAVAPLAISACATRTVSPELEPPAFTPLFDSMPLDTWRVVGGAANFELLPPPNGGAGPTLVGRGPIPQNGFLVSPRVLGDFTLEVDVRIGSSDNPTGDRMNSGIQIRSQERASNPAKSAALDTIGGLQIEIDPSPRAWSGGVYDERGRGWLAPLAGTRADGEPVDNAAGRAAFRVGEWNTYRIECDGPRVRTSINGVACAEWLDATVSGRLAFQVHGGPACEVAFCAPRIVERGKHSWRAWSGPASVSASAAISAQTSASTSASASASISPSTSSSTASAASASAANSASERIVVVPADCRGIRARVSAGSDVTLRFGDSDQTVSVRAPRKVAPSEPSPSDASTGNLDDSTVALEILWFDGKGVVRVAGKPTVFACGRGPSEIRVVVADAARAAVPSGPIGALELLRRD